MNPSNQNYQPYSNQYNKSPTNYQQNSNSQQQNGQFSQSNNSSNTLNLPQNGYQRQTNNQGLSFNKGKIDRAMYSSTIEPSTQSKGFGSGGGFSKLQSMGRFVGGAKNTDQTTLNRPRNDSGNDLNSIGNQSNSYLNKQEKPKNLSPYSPSSQQKQSPTEFDRFPAFNLADKNNTNNSAQKQSYNSQQAKNQSIPGETAEEKRRRQILAIKQELQSINKKMETSNLNKKYQNDSQKNQDFGQNKPNSQNSGYSYNSGSTSSSITNNGLSFNNQGGLNVPTRNKGGIAQSMIVSNEPLPGYKAQPSLFEKYESLKKPTYEVNQVQKDDNKPSLLDKFVNKGSTSNSTFQNTASFNNKSQEKKSFQSYDFSANNNNVNTTKNQDYSSPYTSSANTNNQGSTGMFKKKNPYVSDNSEKTDYSKFNMTPPENTSSNTSAFTFKKTKQTVIQTTYEQNLVTKAMKNMKIEQSVQFTKQDFKVGKKLGKGQFGEVMVVQHKKTGFLCGMKVMEKKQIRDQKYQGQITRELSIQFYLAHRNITPLYGYFQDELNVYLLIQYCTGGQLLEMLRKNRRMQEPEVSRVIKQIIEGIDYIHKELIIHRDIKPENILFNFGVAKICDFGWAVYKGHGMRKTASVGSPLYYSPQIVMGVEYDQKIDIWDVGMMTYECLLGKIPFRIYSEMDLNRIVQDDIVFPEYIQTTDQAKDFILKIMKKKPQERMQIRDMLRHPFITKYQQVKLPIQIMKDIKEVLTG